MKTQEMPDDSGRTWLLLAPKMSTSVWSLPPPELPYSASFRSNEHCIPFLALTSTSSWSTSEEQFNRFIHLLVSSLLTSKWPSAKSSSSISRRRSKCRVNFFASVQADWSSSESTAAEIFSLAVAIAALHSSLDLAGSLPKVAVAVELQHHTNDDDSVNEAVCSMETERPDPIVLSSPLGNTVPLLAASVTTTFWNRSLHISAYTSSSAFSALIIVICLLISSYLRGICHLKVHSNPSVILPCIKKSFQVALFSSNHQCQ